MSIAPHNLDWEEFPENDDHLPLEERGWYRRLKEREAAIQRFNREHPDFFERMGRAVALHQTTIAIEILMGTGMANTERPHCMICGTRQGLRRTGDNQSWVCQRHGDPTDPAMLPRTATSSASLREALSVHDLRLAGWSELAGQRYALECGLCGDVEEIQIGMSVVGSCVQCRTSYESVLPRFWVLLPKTVPIIVEGED